MRIKYLYCKFENLKGFILKGEYLRFTDINYYINLENEKIRDNESIKTFEFTPNNIELLKINDINLTPQKNIKFSFKTRRVHVLCLSNEGYKDELYERFNADTCIAINVDYLIKILKSYSIENNLGWVILGRKIKYYKINEKNIISDKSKLVFIKNYEKFKDENEFRIVIFYPFDEKTIYNNNLIIFGESDYIEIRILDEKIRNKIIVNFKKR